MRQLAGEKFDPAIKVLKNHGVIAIFALNVMPAPPFAVQGLIAGCGMAAVLPWLAAMF